MAAEGDDPKDPLDSRPGSAWQERRPRPTKRVTLELSGVTLALPGESPRRTEPPPGLGLTLPDDFHPQADEVEPLRIPAAPLPSRDGWSTRQPAAAPPRKLSSVPPPPLFVTEESNEALALVGVTRLQSGVEEIGLEREMVERFELGDFSGALRAAELVLGDTPGHRRAEELSGACRDRLAGLYLARLGGGQRQLVLAVAPNDVRWLGIDHRAGFMLAQIHDGTSVEELVDVSGLPRHDALRLLVELVGAGAVQVK